MKRLISALLIIIFFLMLGYGLLIYATGKRLTRDGKLVGVGIIQVDATPDNSKIYLNNELKKEGDTNIENLRPGRYTVKVEKENYSPWQKEIEVVEGKVIPLRVKLFPSNPSLTAATFNGVFSPKISPDNRKIAFGIQMEGKKGLWVLDLADRQFFFNNNTLRQIVSDTPLFSFSDSTFSWSPDSNQVLVETKNSATNEPAAFLLSQETLNQNPENILATVEQTKTAWNEQVVKTNADKLKKLGKEAEELSANATELLFSKDGKAVIIVNTDKTIVAYDTEPTPVPNVEPLKINLPSAARYLWFEDGTKHIAAIENNVISIMDTDGTNKASIFTGDFDPNSVFSWPDGTRLILTLNLNSKLNPLPNLYTIDLR